MDLNDRKKKILTHIIDDYINSAEPVGSKTIVDKYDFGCSSATIRNDMKELEEEGYLDQLHISSGRVPSSKGYRYYVNNLMKADSLSMVDINYIDNSINGYGDTEHLLKQVTSTVSKILNRPAMLSIKNIDVLENIKLLKISEKLVLVVLLSKNGKVIDVFAKLTDKVEENNLIELSKVLNTNLKGTPLENVYTVISDALENELKKYSDILSKICESIKEEVQGKKVVESDLENMLNLPEFSDVSKIKNFMNMLSTKEIIESAINKIESEDIGIVIGSENNEMILKDYSIMSLDLPDEMGYSGKISVISPKRMDYSKTMQTLGYINKKIKSIFRKGDE